MSCAQASSPGPVTIGGYTVERPLARGGMATVYVVRGRGPGGVTRRYALKRIHPNIGCDPYFRELFLDEARLLAQLDHPAVCRVLDYGEDGGVPFMVMEYLEGLSLDAFTDKIHRTRAMRREPRFFHMVARLAANLLEGLHAAHELRDLDGRPMHVVHRDISPHNLFALFDGTQRLLDFGIASASRQVHLTECGQVKGKFAYMPPEQAKGQPTDRRADIWAMGVVLWELLAGRRAFGPGLTRVQILRESSEGLPAPSSVDSRVPGLLDEVVQHALSVDVEERYATARLMARELELWLGQRGDSVPAADVGDWVRRAKRVMEDMDGTACTPVGMYNRDTSGCIVPASLDDLDEREFEAREYSQPGDFGLHRSGERAMPAPAPVTVAATPSHARAPVAVRAIAQSAATQASTPMQLHSEDVEKIQTLTTGFELEESRHSVHPLEEIPAVTASRTRDRRLWAAAALSLLTVWGGLWFLSGESGAKRAQAHSSQAAPAPGAVASEEEIASSQLVWEPAQDVELGPLRLVAEPRADAGLEASAGEPTAEPPLTAGHPLAAAPGTVGTANARGSVKRRAEQRHVRRPRPEPAAQMEPETVPAPPAPSLGRVRITTTGGSGALIYRDGELVGRTPLELSLPAGRHVLQLAAGPGEPRTPLPVHAARGMLMRVRVGLGQ